MCIDLSGNNAESEEKMYFQLHFGSQFSGLCFL